MLLISNWLKILRLPNLIIVALTEYALFLCLLIPLYQIAGIDSSLSDIQFALLVFCTLIVTLGGYLINDIFDKEIDLINKPQKAWIGQLISVKQAFNLYFLINLIGFFLAIYVAIDVGDWRLSLLYPSAAGALYWYSSSLKKSAFWGNLLVSVFCAAVVLLIIFAEREALVQAASLKPGEFSKIITLFFGFAFFAFLITMIREMVKDMEDARGDAFEKGNTIPVRKGLLFAKNLVWILTLLLTCFLILFAWWNYVAIVPGWSLLLYALILVPIPVISILFWLKNPNDLKALKKLSLSFKILMGLGLVYLVLFKFIYF